MIGRRIRNSIPTTSIPVPASIHVHAHVHAYAHAHVHPTVRTRAHIREKYRHHPRIPTSISRRTQDRRRHDRRRTTLHRQTPAQAPTRGCNKPQQPHPQASHNTNHIHIHARERTYRNRQRQHHHIRDSRNHSHEHGRIGNQPIHAQRQAEPSAPTSTHKRHGTRQGRHRQGSHDPTARHRHRQRNRQGHGHGHKPSRKNNRPDTDRHTPISPPNHQYGRRHANQHRHADNKTSGTTSSTTRTPTTIRTHARQTMPAKPYSHRKYAKGSKRTTSPIREHNTTARHDREDTRPNRRTASGNTHTGTRPIHNRRASQTTMQHARTPDTHTIRKTAQTTSTSKRAQA